MKKVNRHTLPGNLKAQGLSLDTIIIAAIVLIVLIVLWAIFTGRLGLFTQQLGATREASCPSDNWKTACDTGETIIVPEDASDHPGQVCCKPLATGGTGAVCATGPGAAAANCKCGSGATCAAGQTCNPSANSGAGSCSCGNPS